MLNKNKLSLLLFMISLIFLLSGCKNTVKDNKPEQINIVCAMFPEYDWSRNIVGNCENINITYLIGNGSDPHSYQPSVKDIALIASADIFIYTGGESEEWITQALALDDCNPNMVVINMMELLEGQTFTEEEKDGMQEELRFKEKEEEAEIDEHVWLSLKRAVIISEKIAYTLCEAMPSEKETFEKNVATYTDKLNSLDEEYMNTVFSSSKDVILVADRFPFRYLVEDYKINYYAAFTGCSTDAEASFKTLVFLSKCIDENDLSSVIVLEGSDEKLAKAAIRNSNKNCDILVLDSMQAVRSSDAEEKDYIETMRQNLEVIKKALR